MIQFDDDGMEICFFKLVGEKPPIMMRICSR